MDKRKVDEFVDIIMSTAQGGMRNESIAKYIDAIGEIPFHQETLRSPTGRIIRSNVGDLANGVTHTGSEVSWEKLRELAAELKTANVTVEAVKPERAEPRPFSSVAEGIYPCRHDIFEVSKEDMDKILMSKQSFYEQSKGPLLIGGDFRTGAMSILSAPTSSRKSVISGFSDFCPEAHKSKSWTLDKKSSDCKPFLSAKVRATLKAKRKSQKEARRNGRKGR